MQDISSINNQLANAVSDKQYVTFSIDEEEFAVEILKVQEIIGYIKPMHIPEFTEYISGVINLRGEVIPILDLRKKFDMPQKAYDKFTVILVVEVAKKIIGIIVDSVSDVLSLSEKDIQDAPEFSKFESKFLKGMGKVGEKLIMILDIDKILTYEEYKKLNNVE